MTAYDLWQHLCTLGVRVTPAPDGTLHCRAKKGTLTPELVEAIRQCKPQLHALVEDLEERLMLAEDGPVPLALSPCVSEACRHFDVAMAGDVLMCCHCRQALF
jgi:hypothetical protein